MMHIMTGDIAIIICTEKGPLENMARLLVSSLREFGGALKDIPIYSYQPRKGWEVSQATRKFFETNNVTLIDKVLNEKYSDYPLANKILASSHAEQMLKNEFLVFLDTDIFFMAEPAEFIIPENYDVVLRPVDSKNVGAENKEDPNWEFWRKMYALTGVDKFEYVTTSVDQKRILAYWNGGHLVVRREKNIFQKWEENFNIVMKQGLVPDDGIFFLEQSVFAATISAMKCEVKQFSHLYNYPIHLQSKIPDPGKKIKIVSEAISMHYHRIFREKHATAILSSVIDPKDDKSRWLIENLVNVGFLEKGDIPLDQTVPGFNTDKHPGDNDETYRDVSDKDRQIELLKYGIQQRNKRIKRLEQDLIHEKERLKQIRQSLSWKTGRLILKPFILVFELFKRVKPQIKVSSIKFLRTRFPFLRSISPQLIDSIHPSNKKVIYTVILGDYDTLKEPEQVLDDWDYICFTDNNHLQSSVWQIIRVKCPADLDLKRCAAYFFHYPFNYLAEYELSLMIGGMISINCDLNEFLAKNLPRGTSMAVARHPVRDCIYDEAERVKELKKAVSKEVDKQMEKYRKEGFPAHYGLVQSGVMIRKHLDKKLRQHFKLGLKEIIRHSQRDQLSFNYILWKYKLVEPHFMPPDIFKNEFRVKGHNYKQQFK